MEADLESEKVAKKRAQNHDFFILSFLKFYNLKKKIFNSIPLQFQRNLNFL